MRKLPAAVALLIVLIGAVGLVGFWLAGDPPRKPIAPVKMSEEQLRASIEKHCSTCHQYPAPKHLPRDAWPKTIGWMRQILMTPGRTPAKTIAPPEREIVRFYSERAPEELALADARTSSPASPIEFETIPVVLEEFPSFPAVSDVRFVRLEEEGPLQLLICDMRHGAVTRMDFTNQDLPTDTVARTPHPSRTEVVDFDRDGTRDILVCNLGVFMDEDTHAGSVVWIRQQPAGRFEQRDLVDGLSRVTDVRAADFDSDGDLDLVVAAFGHFQTGNILYFDNNTEVGGHPDLDPYILDARTGTVRVPPIDLNGDGKLDFVALFAQEHESVVAFLNVGYGQFEKKTIFTAEHPLWGSTGIELVDMDADGDLDLLYANGDSFEKITILKPYHGIGWLENDGSFPFVYHRLTDLFGGIAAKAGDLDGDGDLDIVACVFVPRLAQSFSRETLIWLEQLEPGRFRRHVLETANPLHATLDLGDYDADGDLDIVVGNFRLTPSESDQPEPSLLLLQNQTRNEATRK